VACSDNLLGVVGTAVDQVGDATASTHIILRVGKHERKEEFDKKVTYIMKYGFLLGLLIIVWSRLTGQIAKYAA
jgi:hypothetical protein